MKNMVLGMDKQDERKLPDTLKSIDGTLKRIEQSLKEENRIKEAVGRVYKDFINPVAKELGKSPLL